MIPSANRAMRPSPPPENRFRSPRMLWPPKFFWIALTAARLMPGAGMCAPRRYRARSSAVKRIFLRMSATRNAPRIVEIISRLLLRGWGRRLDLLAIAAGRLDRLARLGAERVGVNGERLAQLALGEHLDRHVLASGEALVLERFQGHRRARVEAGLEAAQLAHPHVDGVLAALEVDTRLVAGPRARSLLAAPRGLAGP